MKAIRALLIIFAVIFGLLSFNYVNAANQGSSLKGLKLSPLRTEVNLMPGTSTSGQLEVTNSTDGPMVVAFSSEEFKVTNANYDYEFFDESEIAKWVTFKPSEINLKAGESKKVTFTIGAPLRSEPGGYYISMFAKTAVSSSGAGGNSQQRLASLLYITVDSDVLGAVTRAGHVLSLSSPWLVINKGTWAATIQNSGTTHYRSEYSVKVEDLFGGLVGEDKSSALILPSTIRSLSGELPLPTVPGIYKATYTIGLGDLPSISETHYMFYMPVWMIVLLLVALAIGGYMIHRKLYHKHGH